MTKAEKDQLRTLIPQRIVNIKRDIVELVELTKPIEPDCAIGRVSRMDAINNKSINDAALIKKRLQLEGLEASLKSLDEKNFGKCLVCGNEIQMGRILIMPESRKCMACASGGR
jgi:DnaK suppressor protein